MLMLCVHDYFTRNQDPKNCEHVFLGPSHAKVDPNTSDLERSLMTVKGSLQTTFENYTHMNL